MKIIQRQQVKLCNWEKILKLRIKVRMGGGPNKKKRMKQTWWNIS